jgi:hypothetical protein
MVTGQPHPDPTPQHRCCDSCIQDKNEGYYDTPDYCCCIPLKAAQDAKSDTKEDR